MDGENVESFATMIIVIPDTFPVSVMGSHYYHTLQPSKLQDNDCEVVVLFNL